MPDPGNELMDAFLADDQAGVAKLLASHPALAQHLNKGVFKFGMPPLAAAKSAEMVDTLLAHGAQLETVSNWWNPGFFADQVSPPTAQYLVQRGASISIHAAVAIGLADVASEMLAEEPDLAHAKGGDGARPLHFCTSAELAALLLEHRVDLDARDDDHDSTPAQWRIGDSPTVVKLLLEAGATADIFMAAALGDLELARQLVARDPDCTTYRIGKNSGPFPGIGFQDRGGSIYQWTLGFNLSPHQVSFNRGHQQVFEFLLQKTPAKEKFLVACTMANRELAEVIQANYPRVVDDLDEDDLALMAKYCWETNKDIEAVRLMLDVGFPVDAREFNHGCTALHNAAWCGDPELAQLLVGRGHPTDVRDPDFDSTPIGWAVHSCIEAKRHPDGRFAKVVELLLANGTPFDASDYPVGDAAIDEVLKRHLEL